MKLKMPDGPDEGVDAEICMGPYRQIYTQGGHSIAFYLCSCCGLRQREMEDHVHPLAKVTA